MTQPIDAGARDREDDLQFCVHGDLAPASGPWTCPLCNADWHDDDEPMPKWSEDDGREGRCDGAEED